MSGNLAKKRKKNDGKPVATLDYFFARQKAAASAVKEESKSAANDANADEELARRLQEQWDAESLAEVPGRETEAERKPSGDGRIASEAEGSEKANDESTAPVEASESKRGDLPQTGPRMLVLQSTAAEEDTVTGEIPFDESPLTFEPSKYSDALRESWAEERGHASYALLVRCFTLVNGTQSRIRIVDTLVNLLRTIIETDPEALLPAVWLTANAISPPYESLELGLGGSAISKALKKVCGLDNARLKSLYNKHGDPGDVAFEAKKRQAFTLRKPKPLTIKSVFDSLVGIASSKGQGSREAKQRIVDRLLQDARGAEESRYIVRTLVQNLRIGAVRTTMLIALSRAFLLSRPFNATFPIRDAKSLSSLKKEELSTIFSKAEATVKACFARRPNYNDLVPTLLEIGVCDELLVRCGLTLHQPLRPMLGSITRDLAEMLTKLQGRDFSCEYKYDGQRAQVHCDATGRVSIFSRHLELMTDKYPDLVALVPQIRGYSISSFILEGEVVAVDKETGELKPFQVLSNRARKDVAVHEVKVVVCLFAFDLMYLNGEELLDRPFRERRSLLRSLFIEIPHRFTWVKSLDATSADADTVLEFFKCATTEKCEGIMAKVLDSLPLPEPLDNPELSSLSTVVSKKAKATKTKTKSKSVDSTVTVPDEKPTRRKALLASYEPDKRLDSWLKVKKDYHASTDTLDLVPIAAWHGNGRKAKWWSPILLAVRNPTTGSLVAVTKCMSGFSDVFYAQNRATYDPAEGKNTISRPHYVEYHGPEPDVWFEPREVWEVVFADITLSPTYMAAMGLVSEERGLSLRFPRFLRVREDKSVDDASTEQFLAELWWKQEERGQAEKGKTQLQEEEDI
ncbi:DNA ligase-like protein I [Trichodelitschia bisporula]|uniref:DNA ligase n=1 Tax=Trichodelitschia bisporula TaxID=703511 RepID=A0A6G1HVZ4_9PEZI|nr:DNA ligase-like protein I [Trichodelitschia bisporula]